MTRQYDEPVHVRRRDDVPSEFLWRGRLYVVREVLSHWVETGAWWQAPAARAVYGEVAADGAALPGGAASELSLAIPAEPQGVTSTLEDIEREVWRVEAAAGRFSGSGVYDLTFDWSAGAWTLARTQD